MKFIPITDSIEQLDFYESWLKLKKSPTFQRIITGTFWNAFLSIYNKGVTFIGTVIIIRLLGREAFGEFGMLNTTISMFGILITTSISQTVTKYVAQYRNTEKEKVGRIIGFLLLFSISSGLLLLMITFLISDEIALKSLNAGHLSGYLKLMTIGILFGSINGTLNGIISGFEAFKTNAIAGVLSGTFITGLKVLLTYIYGFKGAIIGIVIEPVIMYLIISFIVRKLLLINKININYKDSLKEFHLLLNYSLPSFLNALMVLPTNWYCMTIIARSVGGYKEVGAYNAANQWYNMLIFIPYILVSTFLPVFSEMLTKNNTRDVVRIIKNSMYILSVVFILLSIIFLVFGEDIAKIYGDEFKGTGLLIFFAVITLLPQSIIIVLSNLVMAMDRIWFSFWVNFLWCIVFISSTYMFMSSGAMGLILARLVAFSCSFFLMVYFFINWFQKTKTINHS